MNAAQSTPYNPERKDGWTVETLNEAVDAEISALPTDIRAAFLRLAERIEAVGLDRIGSDRRTSSICKINYGRCD